MDYNTALTSEYFLKAQFFRKQRAVEYLFNEVRRNKLTFGSTRAWLRESFGKHMSPLPRIYRNLCPHSRGITAAAIDPIPAELPQQSSPLPR